MRRHFGILLRLLPVASAPAHPCLILIHSEAGGEPRLAHKFPAPLTQLSEEECLFYSTVRQFAEETIATQVNAMDEQQQYAAGLVDRLFELGLMGIEVPEDLGGAGGSFFDAVLAIEAISTVDPAVAVLVDVHNTLVVNALRRWATIRRLPASGLRRSDRRRAVCARIAFPGRERQQFRLWFARR